MNYVLCGMMGSGKSTVGEQIAALTGRCWCDTDALIAEKYGEISTLFERHGEEFFRGLENEIVEKIALQDGLVVSTGGGLVLQENNVALLREKGKLVFLRAKLETLVERVQSEYLRPLLRTAEDLREKMARLLEKRAPIYERIADYVVDVDGKTPYAIAKEIISVIGE